MNIVANEIELDAQLAEFFGDNAQAFDACIFNGDIALRHGGKPDKGTYFDHIRQHAVFSATEIGNPFDGEQVAANAADLCAHPVEHFAKLLQVRLAGSVINGGGAIGHNGGHDDVGRACNGRLVQQHVHSAEIGG